MAKVFIEDLSGTSTPVTSNPYDALINFYNNDPQKLQDHYQGHRVKRNSQQKAKILDPSFVGWILDEHLVKLDGPGRDSEYVDPRHCLVFWARPPGKVRNLIHIIQQKLADAAPDIWLMPSDNLHMTAMEVAHSMTQEGIDHLVGILHPKGNDIVNYTNEHRTRLIKPMLSYDSAALALSFIPAAGEALSQGRTQEEDQYTYHHLRRDLHTQINDAGVKVGSRYVVPSAHLTIARFNTPNVFGGDPMNGNITLDLKKRAHWIQEIDLINHWLENEFWPKEGHQITPGGEWWVGEEKGLDHRKGKLWYGGGETVRLGEGFEHE